MKKNRKYFHLVDKNLSAILTQSSLHEGVLCPMQGTYARTILLFVGNTELDICYADSYSIKDFSNYTIYYKKFFALDYTKLLHKLLTIL